MSYTSTRMRKRAARSSLGPRGRGMGDAIDDSIEAVRKALWDFMGKTTVADGGGGNVVDNVLNKACGDSARAKGEEMYAKATDLDQNWNPAGLYSLEQMQSIVKSIMDVLLSASSSIDNAMANWMTSAQRSRLQSNRTDIQSKMSSEGLVFTNALGQAMKNGISVVDAPGLKRWVVTSMRTAATAMVAASYEVCTIPAWISAYQTFQKYFDIAWNVVRTVAGVAVQLGQQVLKIPDAIGQIWTLAKYGAIGLIAWWAYENIPKHLEGA